MALAVPSHDHAADQCGRTPGSQTPGVPATPEPSTTNSCWPSRAQKTILRGSSACRGTAGTPQHENRNVDHHINVQQLGNLCRLRKTDHRDMPLHQNRGVDDLKKDCDCTSGLSGQRHQSLKHDGQVNNHVQELPKLSKVWVNWTVMTSRNDEFLHELQLWDHNGDLQNLDLRNLHVPYNRDIDHLAQTELDHGDQPLRYDGEANELR